jgi:3-methylfumaryl-CoA hydratase
MTDDLDRLADWIGRSMSVTETASAWPIQAMAATLDRTDPVPQAGSAIPPGWHWLYFNPAAPASELGADGHPKRGGFLPPVPLPRRMWAGGRLRFERPLTVGAVVTRDSTIAEVTVKRGRSGTLVFVTVRHALSDEDGLCLTEEHDIVYREPPDPAAAPAAPVVAPADQIWRRDVLPDPVMLFRYSALTFNGHRIHYDRPYVTEVEGYPGLIVHGPLIATLLLDLVRREAPAQQVTAFSFRAVRPLFDGRPFTVNGVPTAGGCRLWAADGEGYLCMEATAELA